MLFGTSLNLTQPAVLSQQKDRQQSAMLIVFHCARVVSVACDQDHACENEGSAEDADEVQRLGGEVHKGEVVEQNGTDELTSDDGGDEGCSTEFRRERGAR